MLIGESKRIVEDRERGEEGNDIDERISKGIRLRGIAASTLALSSSSSWTTESSKSSMMQGQLM